MTDIVERLQKRASQAGMLLSDPPKPSPDMTLCTEAAALIASQAARIRELEEGLDAILDSAVLIANGKDEVVSRDALDRARSLSRKGGE